MMKTNGQIAYETYRRCCGNTSPICYHMLPSWVELSREAQDAWDAAIQAALTANAARAEEPPSYSIGHAITRLRESRGISQLDVAREIPDMDVATLSQIEQGRMSVTANQLFDLAVYFNMPVSSLIMKLKQ